MGMVGNILGILFVTRALVVTSTYDLAYIVREIGGANVDIFWFVDEAVEDPYLFEPQAHHIVKLSQAQLFIWTGNFERRWIDDALLFARNPRILEGSPGNLDLSEFVDTKGASSCFILDKDVLETVARVITNSLKITVGFDPKYYDEGLSKFLKKVNDVHRILRDKVSAGAKIAVFSECSGFLAESAGFSVEMVLSKPGERPSADEVRNRSEFARYLGVKYVIAPFNIAPAYEFAIYRAELKVLKVPLHITTLGPTRTYPQIISRAAETLAEIKIEGKPLKKKETFGIVKAGSKGVSMRAGPGGKPIQKLKDGTRVKIIGERGGWYKIGHKGKKGWLRKDFVRVEIPE